MVIEALTSLPRTTLIKGCTCALSPIRSNVQYVFLTVAFQGRNQFISADQVAGIAGDAEGHTLRLPKGLLRDPTTGGVVRVAVSHLAGADLLASVAPGTTHAGFSAPHGVLAAL